NSAYVILVFGIIISIASVILAPNALTLLGTLESVFDAALGYMRISCIGTVAVAAYNWINAVMRALGDSKTPLVFLIVASVLNVLLDILFVVGLNMGVNGAAWATITAQGVAAAGSIIFAFKKNPCFAISKEEGRADGEIIFRCIKTGVPVALQNSVISVSMIFLLRTANSFKNEAVIAAYTATMRVEQLIQQPFASLSAALSTFTGQNMGAGHSERVITGYRKSVKVMISFSLAMLVIFMLLGKYIIGVFVEESTVVEIGANALKLSSCFYIFLGFIHITRGLLNGAGDVGYTMFNGFLEVAGRIGFALLLVNIPAVGYWAVWGTTCLTWLITGLMSLLRYLGGKWKKITV
ncbi:MAG: polysaccharide biosynthesis C-terminal domain-containing protein, partial [Oscillospiraceae bacterium]|nr:polysaccharide biosynthesis C-terminal domain-containing protein [Oscillospiraceae bacterium]